MTALHNASSSPPAQKLQGREDPVRPFSPGLARRPGLNPASAAATRGAAGLGVEDQALSYYRSVSARTQFLAISEGLKRFCMFLPLSFLPRRVDRSSFNFLSQHFQGTMVVIALKRSWSEPQNAARRAKPTHANRVFRTACAFSFVFWYSNQLLAPPSIVESMEGQGGKYFDYLRRLFSFVGLLLPCYPK